MTNTNIAFAFSKPVTPNFFHSRIGSTEWDLMATNDWDIFTTYLGNGASSEFMTTLIASGEDTNVTGGVDTAIGDGLTAYKYYVFKYTYNYSYIYNLSLKAQTGNVSCVLKSGNMSPSFKAFPRNYMRVVTQPWYNGEKVIDGKEMTMKPYADGGCLIGYTDTGAAVNLKLFYMKSNGEKVGKIYNNFTVLGTLNIDENTGIAKGFTNINKIEVPIALSSDNWQFSIKANYRKVSRHQGLFYDKNLNRNFGEIHSTTQTMSSYIKGSWTDGTVALDDGADYWFLFDFSNGVLTSYVKKDDNYIDCPSKENMDINFTIQGLSSFSGHQVGLGNADSGEQWENTIDLSTAVLIENGVETWQAATFTAEEDTFVLSPNDGFSLDGYESPLQVGDLNIPAHLHKSVVFETFEQPVLTANGTIGGSDFAVGADSEIDGSRLAWKAFDGNTVLSDAATDQWHSRSGQPHWLEWYSPNVLLINKIVVFNGADNVLPLNWEVQYSDNNEEWTTGASGTNTALTANAEWEINNITGGYHKFWRFRTTSGSGGDSAYLGITELQISGVTQKEVWVMGCETIPPVTPMSNLE